MLFTVRDFDSNICDSNFTFDFTSSSHPVTALECVESAVVLLIFILSFTTCAVKLGKFIKSGRRAKSADEKRFEFSLEHWKRLVIGSDFGVKDGVKCKQGNHKRFCALIANGIYIKTLILLLHER